MSRQSLIDSFFKSKSSTPNSSRMDSKVEVKSNSTIRKRNLSLIKPTTPTKSAKTGFNDKSACEVIDLISDEEDVVDNSPVSRNVCSQQSNDNEPVSDCSQNTVIYSPGSTQDNLTICTTPPGPIAVKEESRDTACDITPPGTISVNEEVPDSDSDSSSQATWLLEELVKQENFEEEFTESTHIQSTPQRRLNVTPKKTPQSSSSNASIPTTSHSSPRSRSKFFSPTKKRSVINRTPTKVKKNLSPELSIISPSRILYEDDLFASACEHMDDITIFLLTIISKYNNEPSLRHLLDEESHSILLNCLQVVKPGMTLVCRLFWRKPGWYQEEQLMKICAKKHASLDQQMLHNMLKSLMEYNLIEQSSTKNMSFDDFVALLKKDDLKDICKELKLKKGSKQHAVDALRGFCKSSTNISKFLIGPHSSNLTRVLQMMHTKAGFCYKLKENVRQILHRLYIIMYLGIDYSIIREKRLEWILFYDKIGKEIYPINKDMKLDNASVVFHSRADFERYMTAHDTYEDFLLRTDVSEKCNIVQQVYGIYKSLRKGELVSSYKKLPPWLQRYTPEHIYVKILESGIADLKRDKHGGHYLLALDILTTLIDQDDFRQHRKAEWYAEKALILHNCLHRSDEAAEVLMEGFKSNLSEEAKDSLRPRAKKIANQKNITLCDTLKKELLEFATKETILENNIGAHHIYKLPIERIEKRGKVKFEVHNLEGRMVVDAEDYCVYHYLQSGEFTHGEHWEGKIINSIFFLLFWDIIYSKPAGVEGVFLSHFQQFPLDLFTDSFYTNRKQVIDDWLEAMKNFSDDKLLSVMEEVWNSRPETEQSRVARCAGWAAHAAVAACLGGARLAALCARLATQYRYAHSGFPDLTLWNEHTKRIKFVEVKTDSDKPSMKQIQWMQYLREHKMEAEFSYVGANTTKQRCRTGNQRNHSNNA